MGLTAALMGQGMKQSVPEHTLMESRSTDKWNIKTIWVDGVRSSVCWSIAVAVGRDGASRSKEELCIHQRSDQAEALIWPP